MGYAREEFYQSHYYLSIAKDKPTDQWRTIYTRS